MPARKSDVRRSTGGDVSIARFVLADDVAGADTSMAAEPVTSSSTEPKQFSSATSAEPAASSSAGQSAPVAPSSEAGKKEKEKEKEKEAITIEVCVSPLL